MKLFTGYFTAMCSGLDLIDGDTLLFLPKEPGDRSGVLLVEAILRIILFFGLGGGWSVSESD